MGFRREDLLKAKKLTFALTYGLQELFIDASSHQEKEVLNLEFLGRGFSDTVIENCKFKSMEINLRLNNIHGGQSYLIGSTFENCTISIESMKSEASYKGLNLMYCTFINCTFRGGDYKVDSYVTQETVFKDCAFEDVTLNLAFHPNIKLEGTVTYNEHTDIVQDTVNRSIDSLGFIKKG